VLWQRRVGPDWYLPVAAPLPDNETVTVRCGDELVSLAVADGGPRWSTTMADRAGDGHFLLRHGDLWLTDIVRRPQRSGCVVAVREGGEPAWQADLPGVIAPVGAALTGDTLSIVVTEPGDGTAAHHLDLRTGQRIGRLELPYGGDELLPWDGGFLVRSQAGTGLYTLNQDGDVHEISPEPAWRLSTSDTQVVISSGPAAGKPGELHTFAAADLRPLWSAPAVTETAVLAGDEVLAVDRTPGGDVLVARRASDGTEHWRTDPIAHDVLTLHIAGPLAFCGHLTGAVVFPRTGGAPVGELTGYHAPPIAHGDRLYLFDTTLTCLHLS
jgi:hypothetical protein